MKIKTGAVFGSKMRYFADSIKQLAMDGWQLAKSYLLQTSFCQLPTESCELLLARYKLKTANYRLVIANCPLLTIFAV